MILFYDFEVFKHDWLVVIIDFESQKEHIFINDKYELEQFYNEHKDSIWIGYNSRNYDQYILKAILCGFDPKKVNDFIIVEKNKGWQYSNLFRKIPLNNYDVMTGYNGLKTLEGFMGNDIRETTISFDIGRKLTATELEEVIHYCRHDVVQTIEVFFKRKGDFDAHMGLIKTFDLPLNYVSKTQAQLIAAILGAKRQKRDDEFDIKIPDTLQLDKYKHVLDWYLEVDNRDYKKSLQVDVAGVPHTFAWGGIHGAIDKYNGKGIYLLLDVDAMYPSIIVRYNYHSRSIDDPQKFVEILETNLEMKKNKNPLRPIYKLICNTTYGCNKDKYNPLYDPQMANNVCIAGQLLLLDLIEKLEPYCKLIQSNTDGVLIKLDSYDDFETIDDIVYEWESRVGLNMEFEWYTKVYQKDVNNYTIVNKNGKYVSKGAYVKELDDLDYDLPIVNKSMVNFMMHDIPVEKTIGECDELREFQKIVKVSSKYRYGWHGSDRLNDKTFRVFASKDGTDGFIGKQKKEGDTIEKFANTPGNCFINNADINGLEVPEKLDRKWYIDLAKERLKQFGVI